jgi:hypothetical protein
VPIVRLVAMGIAKSLSKLFGLATVTFLGRLPSRDDDRIALVGIGALLWLSVVVAVFVPAWAEALIPFAPDDETITRGLAVGLTIVLPLAIGATVASMHNHRSDGWRGAVRHTLKGYYYAVTIGVTVAAIVVVVPLVKGHYLVKRFAVFRLMVMVPDGRYDAVLDHIVELLRGNGIQDVEVRRPNVALLWLFRRLAGLLGQVFDRPVAQEMRVLTGTDAEGGWFEVTLHSADITIIGRERVASWVHATLADGFDERLLYLTWDDASQAMEDRMRGYREQLDAGEEVDPEEVGELALELGQLHLDKEEWNAVRRAIYRLERDAERARCERVLSGDYGPDGSVAGRPDTN